MNPAALVLSLRDPACFPHAPRSVQVLQTHLSIVCLADDLVFKLKKARTLPFVDFAPLAARRGFCREEVRLNRRLCPATYLGTCSLRRGPDGHGVRFAALGDDDGPDDLDVAVVMQRLPQQRMLDELLRTHAVDATAVEALAQLVAAFHARAERSPAVRALGDPDRLAQFARDNFPELDAIADHGLPAALLTALARATERDFQRLLPLLRARAARGMVVDGHGDLHCRNICMTAPPTVYDCIEFAPAFRCGDVATENAFLVMDLRYRGAPQLAAAYERAYSAAAGDAEQAGLLPVLGCYRAMVRAKVAALAAAETELPAADRANARASARRHLELAAALALEGRGPLWIVVFGPPASGKSTLCHALTAVAGWPHLATDVVRKELAGVPLRERARPEHYTAEFTAQTYAELLARATRASTTGSAVVVLDGNFATPAQRAAVRPPAGTHVVFVLVHVDATTATARATQRALAPDHLSDADASITATRHASFVPPTAAEGLRHFTLDGRLATADLLATTLQLLLDATGN